MRRLLILLVAGCLECACASDAEPAAGAGGAAGARSAPARQRFTGSYDVPTPPGLAAAAHFVVDRITWSSSGTTASLDYDLPKELVGKTVHVAFTGPIDENGVARLAGDAGDAVCDIASARVVCRENMSGLLPLEPDLEMVERLAADSYEGAAQDRIDVARLFSAEPIGVATVDLNSASSDDAP